MNADIMSGYVKAARGIAEDTHSNQEDKAGEPYIFHVQRVEQSVCSWEAMPDYDYELQCIAWLHDTVEDGGVSLDYLRGEGFSERVIEGVDALTRRQGETYSQYIERLWVNQDAVKVKLADLLDNMNMFRFKKISEDDLMRCCKYAEAYQALCMTMVISEISEE